MPISKIILDIKVKPNSGKSEFDAQNKVAYLKSSPEKNKANLEMIKLMSKHFKVPSSRVKIIAGRTSRNKRIEIL